MVLGYHGFFRPLLSKASRNSTVCPSLVLSHPARWHNSLGPLQQKWPQELQFESNPKIGLIGGFVSWVGFFPFLLGVMFWSLGVLFYFFWTWVCSALQIKEQLLQRLCWCKERWCLSRNKQLKARPPMALLAGEEVPSKEGFVKLYLWLAIVKDKKELLYLLYFWMVVSEQGK